MLPKTTQDNSPEHDEMVIIGRLKEELREEREQAQMLVDALEEIANSPIPANEREMASWIETARLLAGNTIQQWNGREVGNPCPHCGKELNRDRNLCCRECGKEVGDGK